MALRGEIFVKDTLKDIGSFCSHFSLCLPTLGQLLLISFLPLLSLHKQWWVYYYYLFCVAFVFIFFS